MNEIDCVKPILFKSKPKKDLKETRKLKKAIRAEEERNEAGKGSSTKEMPNDVDMTETGDENEEYETPRKTVRLSNLITPNPTPLQNKYNKLGEIGEHIPTTSNTTKNPTKINQKEQPCPPLVINGVVKNHADLTNEIKNHVKMGFYIRYAAKSTLIYIKNKEEYLNYKNRLKNIGDEFYTYSLKEDKTHAFVLKGIQGDVLADDIKNELEDEYGIKIHNIFRMKTKQNPLYLIVTDNDITLNNLQHQVRYINNIKIKWERRVNQRPITQCRRCQCWGHATSNCYRLPTCMKCAKNHWTRECQKPEKIQPTCANCKGSHTSCNPECPVYLARLTAIQRNQSQPQPQSSTQIPSQSQAHPQYVPATQPKINVWQQRLQQHTENSTTPARQEPTGTVSGQNLQFSDLVRESNKLNSLIDLEETIRAIATLNSLLAETRNDFEIITVIQNFTQNVLPKFKISRR